MGGPDIEETQAERTYRRSLYFHHTPDSQATFLKLFNAPIPRIVTSARKALSHSRPWPWRTAL